MEGKELSLQLIQADYDRILDKYHFCENDLDSIKKVGEYILQIAKPVLFYEYTDKVYVIVTLGNAIDLLQDGYSKTEKMTEAYMVECISMELLTQAYEQTGEIIHKATGGWLKEYSFLGDKYPLAMMEEIFNRLQPEGVSFNQAYMMTPKKTVVFVSQLQKERNLSECHICRNCSNINCTNRLDDRLDESIKAMPYGYQRILGNGERR